MGLVYTGKLHHRVSEATGNRSDRSPGAIKAPGRTPQRSFEGLSDRENEVLNLAAEGATDKEIARLLSISTATVGTYWARMRAKLGLGGRTAIVAKVLRTQLAEESLAAKHETDPDRQVPIRAKRTEEQYLEAVIQALADIECAPVPLIALDLFGRIEIWNQAASRALGYVTDDVMGKAFPGSPSLIMKSLTAIRNGAAMPSRPFGGRDRLRTKGGEVREAILHLAARKRASGTCSGLIVAIEFMDSAATAAVRLMDPTSPIEKR
jgi:PAS domain S-box-containing protein